MKIWVILPISLVMFIAHPVFADFFWTEKADVLKKDEFLLKERLIYLRYTDVFEPMLYEENHAQPLKGVLSRKEIFELPLELRIGATNNLTIGFFTSYIWNLQNISGNPAIPDGAYASQGLANIGLLGKYGAIKEDSEIPGFSILIKARFPLGDEDLLGEDKDKIFTMKLPLGLRGISLGIHQLISKKIGLWEVHFNLGYEYCAPYTSKKDYLGNDTVPYNIDPGDRILYDIAFCRNFEKFSLTFELNGIIARELKINETSVGNSGMHTLDGAIGVSYHPLNDFSLNIGASGTILSNGRNQERSFGPILDLNQRF